MTCRITEVKQHYAGHIYVTDCQSQLY